MMRRCSVMRIPLARHWASIFVGFTALTAISCPYPIIRSNQVAAKHQGHRGLTTLARVISRAPPDLAEAAARIKPASRGIVLIDFEEYCTHPKAREPPQMEIEEEPRKSAAPPRSGNRDREDFRLVFDDARQDETDERAPNHRPMRNNLAVGQQAFEFVLAPAAPERCSMQGRDRGSIARCGIRQHGLGAREQAGDHLYHRRASLAASCG